MNHWRKYLTRLLFFLGLTGMGANAQTFDSTSDGSDGALDLDTAGVYAFFDPTTFPGLDLDGDGAYHFTTITIAAGVTVDMTRAHHGPVTWLASGDVVIDGIIDLDGEDGHSANVSSNPSLPGAGGYAGGAGAVLTFAQPGHGPGGGRLASQSQGHGGGAGHAQAGLNGSPDTQGEAYGNDFLIPLIGGSGGAGGGGENQSVSGGAGGGAGGGAIFIASSTKITVAGTITADGGETGSPGHRGGGGSGGGIRLTAPVIEGSGLLSVRGGGGSSSGAGSRGRIRLEAFQHVFTGTRQPQAVLSTPGLINLPSTAMPVRVVRVGGVDVPDNPSGSLTIPDVALNETGTSLLEIEATGIPLGTEVTLIMITEGGQRITTVATPLTGTVAASTATASVTIPHGFSTFFLKASWTP